MFAQIRKNRRLLQVLLAVVMLPFVFWGADSVMTSRDDQAVAASVGDQEIKQSELEIALREEQEQIREQQGDNVDEGLLNSKQLRRAVLQRLVNRQLLQLYQQDARLVTPEEQLVKTITSLPAFQEDGKFSKEKYKEIIERQGINVQTFESGLSRDLAIQQALAVVSTAVFAGKKSSEIFSNLYLNERQVEMATIKSSDFASKTKPDSAEVEAWYNSHTQDFVNPEQVKVEYLVLDASKLNVNPDETQIEEYYQANQASFGVPEQRRASHILISKGEGTQQQARSKAEGLLAKLKKRPQDFTKLAKQNSDDPGSSVQGGDLGWFGKGVMVAEFDKAVFSLAQNRISDLVSTDFGYHIIKVTGIKPTTKSSLEDVRGQIVATLRDELSKNLYNQQAEDFINSVYEQANNLQTTAEKFKLKVEQFDWASKDKLQPPLDHPKIRQAIFSPESVNQKLNTEAIEVSAGKLVAARVLEHRPTEQQNLDSVREQIQRLLIEQKSLKLAEANGKAKLEDLQQGKSASLTWSNTLDISRLNPHGLPLEAINAIFTPDLKKKPSYTGATLPGSGYALFRIKNETKQQSKELIKLMQEQYQRLIANTESAAWLEGLQERYSVKITPSP